MAKADGICVYYDLRPCTAHNLPALFHRWIERDEVFMTSHLEGQTKRIALGIVEYADGEVMEVMPEYIKFIDDKHREYSFEGPKEAQGQSPPPLDTDLTTGQNLYYVYEDARVESIPCPVCGGSRSIPSSTTDDYATEELIYNECPRCLEYDSTWEADHSKIVKTYRVETCAIEKFEYTSTLGWTFSTKVGAFKVDVKTLSTPYGVQLYRDFDAAEAEARAKRNGTNLNSTKPNAPRSLTFDELLHNYLGRPAWLCDNTTDTANNRWVIMRATLDTYTDVLGIIGGDTLLHRSDYGKTWKAYTNAPEDSWLHLVV